MATANCPARATSVGQQATDFRVGKVWRRCRIEQEDDSVDVRHHVVGVFSAIPRRCSCSSPRHAATPRAFKSAYGICVIHNNYAMIQWLTLDHRLRPISFSGGPKDFDAT